ncbi:MAG: LacI family DNA-binding transcriptional regulator [Pseudomonadota bacterium]
MAKVRLKDVAAVAGVSQGTASNVFNRPETVTPELRTLVLDAAARLGYTGPQPVARMLRSGKVGLVALLTDESAADVISDAYGRRLLAGAARACDAAGIGLTIVGDAAKGETRSGWSVETALADGFVLYCFAEDEIFERVRRRNLPFVGIDGGRRAGVVSVGIDDEVAAAEAMKTLTGVGHRRIGILSMELSGEGGGGPVDPDEQFSATYETTQLRLKGYRREAAAVGLEPQDLPTFQTFKDEASVANGVAWLMDRPEPPTAIAAMSDVIAMIAVSQLKARGYGVPDDVSVVGFDGVPEGAYLDPPLTTVAQPAEEKGEAAVEILLGTRVSQNLVLPAKVISRRSVAPKGR